MNTRKIACEYRLQSWGAALQERKTDRESVKGFCERKGISKNTYYYWQRKLRKATIEMMVEMSPALNEGSIGRGKFTEVQIAETPAQAMSMSGGVQANSIIIEIGGIKITADSSYQIEKLAALCRELMRSC